MVAVRSSRIPDYSTSSCGASAGCTRNLSLTLVKTSPHCHEDGIILDCYTTMICLSFDRSQRLVGLEGEDDV
jgi:hypothetical protein